MKIQAALIKFKELSQKDVSRLEDAELVLNGELTTMGERFRDGKPTEKDLDRLRELFSKWYCYTRPKSYAKSPADCGDR